MADFNNPITQVTTTDNDAKPRKRRAGWLSALFPCCLAPEPEDPVRHLTVDKVPHQASFNARNSAVAIAEPALLPPVLPEHRNRKCLVLDLDETLVHSSFMPVRNADFIIPVDIDGIMRDVYVLKRPHVDEFLRRMGELYEIVVFTASLAKYADPVMDKLDIHKVITHRLFRESCTFYKGNYVKDLSRLGRELRNCLIIDNSPASYIFQPEYALPISSWLDNPNDQELLDLIQPLTELTKSYDVADFLRMML